MEACESLENLRAEMSHLDCDVKAETLVAIANKEEALSNRLLVSVDRGFVREFSKDVFSTELKEGVSKLPVLNVHLSRKGLYDYLQEG
jgi:hypothetical protein